MFLGRGRHAVFHTARRHDLVFRRAPEQAVQGTVSLTCENGEVICADVNPVTGTEIDITHTFDPPKRTEYRRSLVSCRFHDEYEGVVSPGWFECNRIANG